MTMRRALAVAAAFAGAMSLFALLIHRPATVTIAFAALSAAGCLLAYALVVMPAPMRLLGIEPGRANDRWLLTGALLGVVLGFVHRAVHSADFIPLRLTWMALVGLGIGVAEEIAYRGFVQGLCAEAFSTRAKLPPVLLAAMAHTAYKCCLFVVAPEGIAGVDLWWLGSLTLAFGVLFGLLRCACASVWPAILAHALFDVIAYGHLQHAPWWVFA